MALQRHGRPDQALARLAEVDTFGIPESDRAQMDGNRALVLLALDRPGEALARVERALRFRASASVESVVFRLSLQVDALERLGRHGEALESSAGAVAMVEGMRARLVPGDDVKRGFGEARREPMFDHVARLAAAARPDDALGGGRARPCPRLSRSAGHDRSASGARGQVAGCRCNLGRCAPGKRRTSRGCCAHAQRAGSAHRRPPERLGTHIVSYRITRERTFVWIVSPAGHVSSAVADVAEARLGTLVERSVAEVGGPTRAGRRAPLLRLSFAALMAPSGQYLVEDLALHYATSANALDFTGPTARHGAGSRGRHRRPRSTPGWATPTCCRGGPAPRERGGALRHTVRQAISGARVLHFATHGIVRDDRPFDSFLALTDPAGPAPTTTDD